MHCFPYFVGLNQIEMSERARDWHCRLLSLVNFGAFTTKRPQKKQIRRRKGWRREQLAPEYIHTSRQLEAPSRSRCRRCLRILAIFRPAAPDEATRFFLFFSCVAYCYFTCSPERRKVATVGNMVMAAE